MSRVQSSNVPSNVTDLSPAYSPTVQAHDNLALGYERSRIKVPFHVCGICDKRHFTLWRIKYLLFSQFKQLQ